MTIALLEIAVRVLKRLSLFPVLDLVEIALLEIAVCVLKLRILQDGSNEQGSHC